MRVKVCKIRTKCALVNEPHWDFYTKDGRNVMCATSLTYRQAKAVAEALSQKWMVK